MRPSEAERERVVRLLRDRSVEGRISTDTFADRVGLAYGARSSAELNELTSDVRPAGRARRLFLGVVEWLSRLDADIEAAWRRPRVPVLGLPAAAGVRWVIGRAPSCDCLVPDDCVSRHHAEIWRDGERWLLRDVGSQNGTRVNGTLVTEPVEVRPGDRVNLGGVPYRLSRSRMPRPPRL
jgi:hypothetical protein